MPVWSSLLLHPSYTATTTTDTSTLLSQCARIICDSRVAALDSGTGIRVFEKVSAEGILLDEKGTIRAPGAIENRQVTPASAMMNQPPEQVGEGVQLDDGGVSPKESLDEDVTATRPNASPSVMHAAGDISPNSTDDTRRL